jgi:hypothetical protein
MTPKESIRLINYGRAQGMMSKDDGSAFDNYKSWATNCI